MRILVVGAGALGGMVGAHLTESGEDTTIIEINSARARLISDTGLFLTEGRKERNIPMQVVTSVEGLAPMDLIFVSVKSYQTEAAVRGLLPVVGEHTKMLSLQNGIGNTATMAELIGPDKVLCGITYHSIQHVGPNRLRFRRGIKPIQIAPFDGKVTPEIQMIGDMFQRSGLDTEVVESVDNATWQKLLHNAVVNPVSAVTGLTCRELLNDEDMMEFMGGLCAEIIAVMRARGIPIIDEEDPFRPVIGSLTALDKNRPSMWQDLARGTRTEIDAINGAIVDEAERLGLDAPHNRALMQFIHSRERQKITRRREISKTVEASKKSAATSGSVKPTTLAEGGGMPPGRVPLRTAGRLKELVRAYFQDLDAANRDPARRIACCSGMGPAELIRAFGMTPYFPENHAALIGASRTANTYIPRAMAEGFSQSIHSGMACDVGAMLAGDSPLVSAYGISGPPTPDLVVYSTNSGHNLIEWFDYYGSRFDIPVFGLNPPAALGDIDRVDIDAATQQMLRLVGRLEGVTGASLDMDRLGEVVDNASRAATLWEEILELARSVPSPLTVFDLLIHFAPMVLMRGTPEATEYYRILKEEVEERVSANQAAVPGERFRFYWEGPPIWSALRSLSELFLERKVAVVASSFFTNFSLAGLDANNPIESMATAYMMVFPNRSAAYKRNTLVTEFESYCVDGVVYHEGRTSPQYSNVRQGLEVQMSRRTGIPSLIIEADSHDMRLVSTSRLEKQLGEFIESRALAESESS
jgi:2-dehydropantoate 2-reductase